MSEFWVMARTRRYEPFYTDIRSGPVQLLLGYEEALSLRRQLDEKTEAERLARLSETMRKSLEVIDRERFTDQEIGAP